MNIGPHLVLQLLSLAMLIITLLVGPHGHRGEEVLEGVVAQVVRHVSKLQKVSETERMIRLKESQTFCPKYEIVQDINIDIQYVLLDG